MGLGIAIFGAIIFAIGFIGAVAFGVMEAFSMGFLQGMTALLFAGIAIMFIGSLIDSEL